MYGGEEEETTIINGFGGEGGGDTPGDEEEVGARSIGRQLCTGCSPGRCQLGSLRRTRDDDGDAVPVRERDCVPDATLALLLPACAYL